MARRSCWSKKNRVLIFDTESEKLTVIPESDIFLYDVRSNLLDASGYLVATVNKATAVTDRAIIKVIDISGDVPQIISIKNAGYNDRQVSSVSVDAKHGHVAISSLEKKWIAAAKVAPLANQHVFDLTDYRGVLGSQIFIEGDWVTYADADWKVRLLDLRKGVPKAITDQALPSSNRSFIVRKGRLAVMTSDDKVGSRYRYALADLAEMPQTAPGTGTPIERTSGALGMGGSAAIAIDKTVFIAGTHGDGIGVGEHLQRLGENGWAPITGTDGKVIAASDVTTSMGFLAFKALTDEGRTVLGYATYGQRVQYDVAARVASTPSAARSNAAGPIRPVKLEQDNTHNTHDEMDESLLAGLLENEEDTAATYTQVFGEEAGRKKVIDAYLTVLKNAKKEHLIDEMKRRSKLIPAKDKPKPTAQAASDADPRAVAAALQGQWSPLRFEVAGQELPDSAQESLRLTFGDGQYVLVMGANIETGTYEIDTTKAPHAITITSGMGKNKGQVRQGSFKLLEDNRLMVVFATNDSDHPTKFISTEASQTLLAVYTR